MSEKTKYSAAEVAELIKVAKAGGATHIRVDGFGEIGWEINHAGGPELSGAQPPMPAQPQFQPQQGPPCPTCGTPTRPGNWGGFYCSNCQGRGRRGGGGGFGGGGRGFGGGYGGGYGRY